MKKGWSNFLLVSEGTIIREACLHNSNREQDKLGALILGLSYADFSLTVTEAVIYWRQT